MNNEKLRIGNWSCFVGHEPLLNEDDVFGIILTGNPYTVFPDTANPQLLSNDILLSIDNTNNPLTPETGEAAKAAVGVSSSSQRKSKRAKKKSIRRYANKRR